MKNKKILFIILFIIGLFAIFNTKSFAYTPFETEYSDLNEIIAEHSTDFTYYVVEKVNDSYFIYLSNKPFLCNYEINSSYVVNTDENTYVIECQHFTSNNSIEYYLNNSYSFPYVTCGLLKYVFNSNYDIYYTSESSSVDSNKTSDVVAFFHQRGGSENDSGSDNGESGGEEDNSTSGFFASVGNWFRSVISGITQGFSDVIQNIASILSYLNPFDENFFLKDVLDFLGYILSFLNPFSENFLGYKLVDLVKNILIEIFVPDTEVIEMLINNVKSKFSFADDIKDDIQGLKDYFNNIDSDVKLSFNVSNKYYNGNFDFDLSWFSNYKSYSDTIITAFVYLTFVWRLFIRIPSILSGSSDNVEESDSK